MYLLIYSFYGENFSFIWVTLYEYMSNRTAQ